MKEIQKLYAVQGGDALKLLYLLQTSTDPNSGENLQDIVKKLPPEHRNIDYVANAIQAALEYRKNELQKSGSV